MMTDKPIISKDCPSCVRKDSEIRQLENVLGLAMHELHGMESDELHRRYWALIDRSLISTSEKDHG